MNIFIFLCVTCDQSKTSIGSMTWMFKDVNINLSENTLELENGLSVYLVVKTK